ncbi:MAG: endo-1,4-beta-xylanase [Spirochaetaceae bacterium]|jgi:endo-1,4-beta-xylanase|nr:endo-1,4-beta-xylanase [Spirochaetaceae bacterium]
MKNKLIVFVLFVLCAALYGQNYRHVTVIDSTFEDGTLGGWAPRNDPAKGSTRIEIDKTIKHSGTASMRVFDRKFTWMGPIQKLTDNPVAGDVYSITAWVYFKDGPAVPALTFSVERAFKNAAAPHAYQNVTTFQAKKGEWTELKTEYTIGADPTQASIFVYFELPYKEDHLVTANDKVDFWLDDIKIIKLDPASRPKAEMNIPNLADAWRRYFDIGVAVPRNAVDTSSQTAQLLMKHFTVLVAENEQKMETVQPTEGRFDWGPADAIINFGEMTGMRLRWYPLVWHSQNPSWLFRDKANASVAASKELMNQRLRTYVQTVVRRYRGRIESYDVVNEVISERQEGLRTGAEGSRWYEILGAEYIDNAFRWAREADPNAQLVINDFNLERDTRKRQSMYDLVKGMKQRGVPVDAIGIQLHIDVRGPSVQQIRETIELFASLGVKVLITGMDISIYTSNTEAKKAATSALLLEQAQRYKDIFAMLQEQAQKGNLGKMVVLWGLHDGISWKSNYPVPGRTDAPLLFDERFQAKPAFWALVNPSRVQGLR